MMMMMIKIIIIIIIVTAGLQAILALTSQYTNCVCVFFPHGATAPSGPRTPRYRGFTITHTYTHHLDGLIWTSDQPVEATSTGRQTTHTRQIFQIRTCNPSNRAATRVDIYVLMYVRMNTSCVCMYKHMGALCMHVRVYVITYVFPDVKLPTNDRKETSESP